MGRFQQRFFFVFIARPLKRYGHSVHHVTPNRDLTVFCEYLQMFMCTQLCSAQTIRFPKVQYLEQWKLNIARAHGVRLKMTGR